MPGVPYLSLPVRTFGNARRNILCRVPSSADYQSWILYSEKPIKINSLTILNRHYDNTSFQKLTFMRSNTDNPTYTLNNRSVVITDSDWVSEGSYNNPKSNQTGENTWTCNWGSTEYSKWHRIKNTNYENGNTNYVYSSYGIGAAYVQIDAVYQTSSTTYYWTTSIT